jgi:hypothetical protein
MTPSPPDANSLDTLCVTVSLAPSPAKQVGRACSAGMWITAGVVSLSCTATATVGDCIGMYDCVFVLLLLVLLVFFGDFDGDFDNTFDCVGDCVTFCFLRTGPLLVLLVVLLVVLVLILPKEQGAETGVGYLYTGEAGTETSSSSSSSSSISSSLSISSGRNGRNSMK